MSSSRPPLNRTDCLLCGEADVTLLTLEHIIPQALWKRFGVDPNGPGGVAMTHTTLCKRCNDATSTLHDRTQMLDLIETGAPVTKVTLDQVSDWIFWVLLLLSYARDDNAVPAQVAHKLLHDRFVTRAKVTLPRGWRIYAAHTTTLEATHTSPVRHEVLTTISSHGYADAGGRIIGVTFGSNRTVQVALTIGIGRMAFLVLPPTESSGHDHLDRIDAAAAANGLQRIHPMRGVVPQLPEVTVDVPALRDIFVAPCEGDDRSLLPEAVRELLP